MILTARNPYWLESAKMLEYFMYIFIMLFDVSTSLKDIVWLHQYTVQINIFHYFTQSFFEIPQVHLWFQMEGICIHNVRTVWEK